MRLRRERKGKQERQKSGEGRREEERGKVQVSYDCAMNGTKASRDWRSVRTGESGLAAWTRDLTASRGLVRLEVEACSEFIARAIAIRDAGKPRTRKLRGQVSDDALKLKRRTTDRRHCTGGDGRCLCARRGWWRCRSWHTGGGRSGPASRWRCWLDAHAGLQGAPGTGTAAGPCGGSTWPSWCIVRGRRRRRRREGHGCFMQNTANEC